MFSLPIKEETHENSESDERLSLVLAGGVAARVHRLWGSSGAGVRAIPSPTQTTSHYRATLRALNGSGVSGTIDVQLTGNVLAVTVDAHGLEPNQVHYEHLHGSHSTPSTCPTAADAKVLST